MFGSQMVCLCSKSKLVVELVKRVACSLCYLKTLLYNIIKAYILKILDVVSLLVSLKQHISRNSFNNFLIFLAISYCTNMTVLVSQGLCNNVIYYLTILDARSPKSSVVKMMLPRKALEKNPSLTLPSSGSFPRSLAFLGVLLHHSSF